MVSRTVIGIVENQAGQVLLVDRAKNDGVQKSFPSGTVEENETEEAAICREVEEETGQKVSAKRKLGERSSPYNPEQFLCYWECTLVDIAPVVPEQKKILNAWYEDKQNLVSILGDKIFQPVKDHLKI